LEFEFETVQITKEKMLSSAISSSRILVGKCLLFGNLTPWINFNDFDISY